MEEDNGRFPPRVPVPSDLDGYHGKGLTGLTGLTGLMGLVGALWFGLRATEDGVFLYVDYTCKYSVQYNQRCSGAVAA
jgi:hypothetical protein